MAADLGMRKTVFYVTELQSTRTLETLISIPTMVVACSSKDDDIHPDDHTIQQPRTTKS
jgi:hypothetical protein